MRSGFLLGFRPTIPSQQKFGDIMIYPGRLLDFVYSFVVFWEALHLRVLLDIVLDIRKPFRSLDLFST